MIAARPKLLSIVALLGVMFAAPQGNSGIAAETNCRVALMRLPSDMVTKKITGEPFTFEREVDGDGVVDVVRLRESSGSGASSTWGTLTLSASGDVIEISRDVSFSAMINIHIVPPSLVGKDRTSARLLVEDALFGMTCAGPDPSLSRLLDIGNAVVWREGRRALPGNYAVYFPEAPVGLIPFIGAWSELGFGGEQPVAVWVEYLGGTHAPTAEDREEGTRSFDGGFEVLATTPRYRVLGTRHGGVAVDVTANRYAWLYVFSGGYKLRWKSIKGATIEGEKVTIAVGVDYPGAQVGAITVNLQEGGYTETWGPQRPDTDADRPPTE